MQVDTDNFQEVLPQIIHDIQQADFISFDCEFTGLVTQLERIEGMFPNHEEFYQRIKETAYNFRIIQFGIAAFIYHNNNYHPKAYNIYVTPQTFTNGFNNVMVCEVESLQFLAKNHMDFKRTFEKGVKAKRLYANDDIKKHQYNNFPTMTDAQLFLCPKDLKIAENIQNKFIFPMQKNGQLQSLIDFDSKVILNYFRNKYQALLFIEPKKKKNRFEYIVRVKQEFQKYQPAENNEVIFANKTLDVVIDSIIKAKKPIIGHFANLDIGLIYHNFIANLPETYQEFCFELNKIFPQIYDTKVLSRRIQKQLKGLKVDLPSLFKACFNPNLLMNYANIDSSKLETYFKEEHRHQAGYDALITGCAFVGMANYITDNKGHIDFLAIGQENKLLYSRFSGQVSITGSKYCSGAVNYQNTIVIQSVSKKQNPQWIQTAKTLSNFGTLSAHEDRNEIYYVFEQNQNIQKILNELSKFKIKPYAARKIIRAQNMYLGHVK